MMRLRRVPRRIGPEHLVRQLFLPLRHRVVEVVEGRDQLLQMLDVCFGHLLVGLHVLHRVHCRVLLSALQESLIHIAGVFAHDLGELIPLRLLGRRDLQLRVQLFDMVLDAFPCSCCRGSAGRLAPVGKRLSSRNKRAVAVRSNRLAATRNKPAVAVPRKTRARRSQHRRQGR